MLVGEVLPATFGGAYGRKRNYQRAANEDSITVFRRLLRKKIVRSCGHITSSEGQIQVSVLGALTECVDELDKYLQATDEDGDVLWQLIDPIDGVLPRCQSELAEILGLRGNGFHCDDVSVRPGELAEVVDGEPVSRGRENVEMLLRHFGERGLTEQFANNLRRTALSISAQIWYKLEVVFQNAPFLLFRLADPSIGRAEQEFLVGKFLRMYQCCCEENFAIPFLMSMRDGFDLLSDEVISLLREVARRWKSTNMHVARLPTYLSTAAPYTKRKPTVERAAYGAHLNLQQHEFLRRGGDRLPEACSAHRSVPGSDLWQDHGGCPRTPKKCEDVAWQLPVPEGGNGALDACVVDPLPWPQSLVGHDQRQGNGWLAGTDGRAAGGLQRQGQANHGTSGKRSRAASS